MVWCTFFQVQSSPFCGYAVFSFTLTCVKNTDSFPDSVGSTGDYWGLPVSQSSWQQQTSERRRRRRPIVPNMEPLSLFNWRTGGGRNINFLLDRPETIFFVRLDAELSPTTIRVSPVEGERNMFYVRLRTSHYSFSIKNTCVVRSLHSFYQLRAILKVRFPEWDQPRGQGWIIFNLIKERDQQDLQV